MTEETRLAIEQAKELAGKKETLIAALLEERAKLDADLAALGFVKPKRARKKREPAAPPTHTANPPATPAGGGKKKVA